MSIKYPYFWLILDCGPEPLDNFSIGQLKYVFKNVFYIAN
jgi:hypothetical protein